MLRMLMRIFKVDFIFASTEKIGGLRKRRRKHQANMDDPHYRALFEEKFASGVRSDRAQFQILILVACAVICVAMIVSYVFFHGGMPALLGATLSGAVTGFQLHYFNQLKWKAVEAVRVEMTQKAEDEYKVQLEKCKQENAEAYTKKFLEDQKKATEVKAAKGARKAAEAKSAKTTKSAPAKPAGGPQVIGIPHPPKL